MTYEQSEPTSINTVTILPPSFMATGYVMTFSPDFLVNTVDG